jgi:hypothetical protein
MRTRALPIISIISFVFIIVIQGIAQAQSTAVPVASFTSNVTVGNAPLTVQFADTSSNSPTAWNWSFGDYADNVYVTEPRNDMVKVIYSNGTVATLGSAVIYASGVAVGPQGNVYVSDIMHSALYVIYPNGNIE